jgi:hypothetical protein
MRELNGVSGRWSEPPTADALSQRLAGADLPCDLFRSAGAAAVVTPETPRQARSRQPVSAGRAKGQRSGAARLPEAVSGG